MSENVTRVSLASALEADLTDSDRLRQLDDAAIDAACTNDQDSFDADRNAPDIDIARAPSGEWRWRLMDGQGRILAESGEGFASRKAAIASLSAVQAIFRQRPAA